MMASSSYIIPTAPRFWTFEIQGAQASRLWSSDITAETAVLPAQGRSMKTKGRWYYPSGERLWQTEGILPVAVVAGLATGLL